MIQKDLRWGAQFVLMVKKASNKIWMLKRMKQLGLDEATLVHFWIMEARIHLRTSTAFLSGVERVQRRALATS